MKFLVILAALLINHYWTKDRALPGDAWFHRFVQFLQARSARLSQNLVGSQELLSWLAVLVPALSLMALLYILDGVLLGFVSFCVHVALLLLLFDPQHLRAWVAQYLGHWRKGDFEAAFLRLQQRHPTLALDSVYSHREVHVRCYRYILRNSFERLFAVLFWYLALGPVAALAYYSLMQLRTHGYLRSNIGIGDEHYLRRFVAVLEWPAARLLGLTFSLAGNFDATFARLRAGFFDGSVAAVEFVSRCAHAATGLSPSDIAMHEQQSDAPVSGLFINIEKEGYAQQIEDLLALLDRSQIIWLSALALLTLYGFGA